MKTITTVLIFIAALLLAISCFGMIQNKTIAVIEPGVGLGNIKLDDSLPGVLKKMDRKKPTDGKTVKSGNLKEYWLSYSDMGITFIFDEAQKLTRIAVSNPGIIVRQKGIRVNSSVKELMGSYGRAEISKISDKYEQWSYKNMGIVFTVNTSTWKVETITIEKMQRRK